MDFNRIYNNPGLEAHRLALLKRMQAEEVLGDSHEVRLSRPADRAGLSQL